MSMKRPGRVGVVGLLLAMAGLGGCDGLLEVSDPNRIGNEDLDASLQLVANGVEGTVHDVVDDWVVNQALLADVYQNTGTYLGVHSIDHGDVESIARGMSSVGSAWVRALWFATDAEERFRRVLGDAEAATSPLTAQVQLSGALADLYIGMTFCELHSESAGRTLSDIETLTLAERNFTGAIATALSAGSSDRAVVARAGRAQARMLLDDWSGAQSDAASIPTGFSYAALFNDASPNAVVRETSASYGRAAGIMYKWWPLIVLSNAPGFMMDPSSGQSDPRIPVYFDGQLGDDFETPYYSQWKYVAIDEDIPMLHSDLMQLIIAESKAVDGDYGGATAILNELRAAVGLPGYDTPTDSLGMQAILLRERFAELFLEGQRLVDLHRKGMMREVFEALDDPERPGEGRPSKWGECQGD